MSRCIHPISLFLSCCLFFPEIRKVAGNVLLLLTADLPIGEQDIFVGLDKNGLDLFETIVAEDIR